MTRLMILIAALLGATTTRILTTALATVLTLGVSSVSASDLLEQVRHVAALKTQITQHSTDCRLAGGFSSGAPACADALATLQLENRAMDTVDWRAFYDRVEAGEANALRVSDTYDAADAAQADAIARLQAGQ